MMILYVTLGLLAIGMIIFIHEAGHFLAAKKVGVRVDRFALGFDPPVKGRHLRFFAKTWGETEYVIGMIPFGGYVKLAGEIPEEGEGQPLAEDELLAKSVGARALVFVAGAVMNFLSAFVFFMIAFSVGVGFPEPRIGSVEIGSPAWPGGLGPGDQVLEIDGAPVTDYTEVLLGSALAGPNVTLQLKVERAGPSGGEPRIVSFPVTTRWVEERGLSTIGVGASTDLTFSADPPEGTAAAKAGLREGDRIVGAAFEGIELPDVDPQVLLTMIGSRLQSAPGRPIRLEIRRDDGEESWFDFVRQKSPDAERRKALGVAGSLGGAGRSNGRVVKALAPDATLDKYLDPHDEVISVDGKPVPIMSWATLAPMLSDEKATLSVRSLAGEIRTLELPRDELLRGVADSEVYWIGYNARLAEIDGDGTESSTLVAAGLREHDAFVRIGDTPIYSPDDVRVALAHTAGDSLDCVIARGPERLGLRIPASVLQNADASLWRTFEPLAAVDPSGPAAVAGITAGSRITRVGSTEILTFADLPKAIADLEIGQSVELSWLTPFGEETTAHATIGLATYEPDAGLALKTREIVVKTSVLGSFQKGLDRSVIVVKQVFLTLRSLILRNVSAKNLSGPIGITHLFTKVAEMGWIKLLFWMAVVSVNLGVLNLLPFPILDGGHLVFLLIEKIKGSPVSFAIQEWTTRVAFLLIISLALFVTFHDFKRLLFG